MTHLDADPPTRARRHALTALTFVTATTLTCAAATPIASASGLAAVLPAQAQLIHAPANAASASSLAKTTTPKTSLHTTSIHTTSMPMTSTSTSAMPTSTTRPTATTSVASLTLTGTTPPTLTKGSSLSVTVTVRNTGSTKLTGRSVSLSLGRNALDTLDAQSRWSAGEQSASNPITASASVPDLAPGASTDVTVDVASNKLDLTYAMATLPLQLSLTNGSTSSSAASSSASTSASDEGTAQNPTLRSFVTYASTTSAGTFSPMSASFVIPVTLPDDPDLLTASGAARFAAWNKAIGPNSAIAKLLDSNPSVPVTWLIDPAVLDPAAAQDGSLPTEGAADDATATQTPSSTSGSSSTTSPSTPASSASTASASGSTSSGGSSQSGSASSSSPSPSSSSSSSSSTASSSTPPTTPTTVEQLAAALRATVKNRPSTQQVIFTPYGDPDLSTLTADDRPAGSDALLKRSLERQLSPELQAISKTVVAAPPAPLDAAAVARLDTAWTAARGAKPLVLTPNVTLDGSDDVAVSSAARRSTSGVPLIGYTSALSAALSTHGADGDVDAALREQAASLALYQQLPSTSRSLLVMGDRLQPTSPSRLAHVGAALDQAPWAEVTNLDVSDARGAGTIAHLSTKAPSSVGVWPQPKTTAFSDDDVTTAAQTLSTLTKVAGVVADGGDIVPAWTRNLDQEASTRWRGDSGAVDTLVAHAQKAVNAIPAQVHVVPAHINFFSDSGSISVTVKNDLARDVNDLRLALTPRNYAVQFRSQPAPLTVKAKGQTSFRVPVAAQAAGQVSVDARLTAPNGVELGDDVNARDHTSPLEINARPTGTWIFWVLGIVALLVFCYGLLRARQKGTRRRDELAREIQL